MASSMSEAARELAEKYPMDCEFSGKEYINGVIRIYPKARHNFGHTIMRRLREFRHGKNFDIICIDKMRSRYKKVKPSIKRRLKKKA